MADRPRARVAHRRRSAWQQAAAVRTENGKAPSHKKRAPAHVSLSLLRCGCCRSGYSVHDDDTTGKTRIRCSTVRKSGICSDRQIVYPVVVENTVRAGSAELFPNPWLIENEVNAYNAERARLTGTGPQDLERLLARRDALGAEPDRVERAFTRGLIDEARAEGEMPCTRAEHQALEDRTRSVGDSSAVIALEPAAVACFRRSADDLNATLNDQANWAWQRRERANRIAVRKLNERIHLSRMAVIRMVRGMVACSAPPPLPTAEVAR